MAEKKFDSESLRNANRSIILGLIREWGEASRIDLAKATGLSPTTASAITDELMSLGIVKEHRVGESSGGRKPLLYVLDPNGRFVVSGSVGVKRSVFALVGLGGAILESVESGGAVGEAAVARTIERSIDRLLTIARADRDRVLGCALSFPGLIDARAQSVLLSSPLSLRDFSVRGAIARFGFPTLRVYKDAEALLLAEHGYGEGRGLANIAYLWVDSGVGMAYMHEGALMILPRGGLELGHVTIDYDGTECKCGARGCLGTKIAEVPALARLASLRGGAARPGDSILDYSSLIALACRGDEMANRALEEELGILAVAVANIVNLFNPELVVIGGPLRSLPPELLSKVEALASGRILEPFRDTTRITFSGLEPERSLTAMAEVVFEEELFKPRR